MRRSLYDLMYRRGWVPWDTGPREALVTLVENGRIPPGRAIDLGSGTASNCIFLAQHGFAVTGVDFSPAAIALGNERAKRAGVSVDFVLDDLTDLRRIDGTFDLLVDYGTLDDLGRRARDQYVEQVMPLTHPGTRFLLFCFEWARSWWQRPFFFFEAFEPGEARRRFGGAFEIEEYDRGTYDSRFIRGYAVYLMTRREGVA